jgi:hypothetical protein
MRPTAAFMTLSLVTALIIVVAYGVAVTRWLEPAEHALHVIPMKQTTEGAADSVWAAPHQPPAPADSTP